MRKQTSWCFTVCLVGLVTCMPQGDKKTDDRVGLERPSTSPTPEVSECGLDALIGDVFGGGGNTNCNNNNQNQNNNGGGYQPPPTNNNNNGGGYQPPPNNNNNGGGNQPPPNNNNNGGGYPDNGANSKDCECVPFYLCDDNNTIIEDGVGLIDIRLKDECGAYDQKCCGGDHVRQPDNPVITPRPPPVATETRCGIRNFDGVGVRITGAEDNEAQYGEFPWMVAIVQPDASRSKEGKPVNVYQCGGSLIHPRVVLTGAHCVRGKNNLIARAGEWDTQTKNELYPTQDRKVQHVVIHEQFNNNTLVNDPALLILESPVDMSYENVGVICLPQENENVDGRDCVASGWGKDQFGKEGKYQVILKRVDLPIVPRGPCLDALRKTRLGAHFKLHPSFICAGGRPGKDTCKGDGGGPLACPSKGSPGVYVQAGIVAWGISCNTETPGVYVNVPAFVPWIYNKLQQHGISIVGSCGNYNCDKNHNNNKPGKNHPDHNSDSYIPSNTNSGSGSNSRPENYNSGSYLNTPSKNSNGYNIPPTKDNNNGHNPPHGNNVAGDYTKHPTENNNHSIGVYNPSTEKNSSGNGISHPTENNSGSNGYNYSTENSNSGGNHNPTSGGSNSGGVNNRPIVTNNGNGVDGGGYNRPTGNNNNSGGNNSEGSKNRPTENNSFGGGGYKPSAEKNNSGSDDGHKPFTDINSSGVVYNSSIIGNNNSEGENNRPTDSSIGNNNSGGGNNHPTENNSGISGYNHPTPNSDGGGNLSPSTGDSNSNINNRPTVNNNGNDSGGGSYNRPTDNNSGVNNNRPNDNNYNGGGSYKPTENHINGNSGTAHSTENNHNGGSNSPPKNNNGDSKDCECVPFFLCDDNSTVAEDGVGLLDIRIKDECDAYDKKCCEINNVRTPDKPVIPIKPRPGASPKNHCGIRNTEGVRIRITGAEDNEAQYGEFPWMVAIVQPDPVLSIEGKPVNIYQCGGSLIHPQVVLTGAHCVRGKKNLVVRAGEWDTQTKNELYPTQDSKVEHVIIHEQFNNKTLFNDPALLILKSPVDITNENVGLICLPGENENMDGRDCVASGWGKDKFGKEGEYQVILKKVELPIVSQGPCLEALRKTKLGTHFKLHPSFICAGGRPGKDTCKGDGGSPLACPSKTNPGVYVQAGIVAWGISCGTETPGVYVNVPSFVSWMHEKLKLHGITLNQPS